MIGAFMDSLKRVFGKKAADPISVGTGFIAKNADPFIPEEFLEFKEAFQKNISANKGIYVYLIVVKLYFYFI